MRRPTRSAGRPLELMERKLTAAADFSDPESQRVLRAASRVLAFELGLAAGREYFDEMIGKPKAHK
jgi:hypothetical protein